MQGTQTAIIPRISNQDDGMHTSRINTASPNHWGAMHTITTTVWYV